MSRAALGLAPTEIEPEGDKITRMSNQSPKIEAGHVILPGDASWLEDFKVEVLAFPNDRFDHQVDCLSQFPTQANCILAQGPFPDR